MSGDCGVVKGAHRWRYRRVMRGRKILRDIAPDQAEIKLGGPPPLPRGKLVWDQEKRARTALLRRRLNL
ncbi:MAG: hypothetical protein ACLP5V_16140 [Candidatus Bathyarchaeia archaeon]